MFSKDDIVIPHSIYFDTNSLIQAGDRIDKPWIVDLRALAQDLAVRLCIPTPARDEWVRFLTDREHGELARVEARARSITHLLDRELIQVQQVSTDAFENEVRTKLDQRIEKAGFTLISVPELSVGDLLRQAVARHPPFEANDKGFRDAVILETIKSDVLAHRSSRPAVVVSSDRAVRDGVARLESTGAIVKIASPADVVEVIEHSLSATKQAWYQSVRSVALEYLNGHREEIFKHVMSGEIVWGFSLTLPDPDLRGSVLKCVNAVRPIGIADARPGYAVDPAAVPSGRYPITFSVEIELEVTIERAPPFGAFEGQRVRLAELGEVAGWPLVPASPRSREDRTIRHSTMHLATVLETDNPQNPYSDLQLVW